MSSIILRDKLNIDGFNPMDIDTSEFEELQKEIPRDANIDLYTAERIAHKALWAADRCGEILVTLGAVTKKAENHKKHTHSRLFLEAREKGFKTSDERKCYAETHDDFIEAEQKHIESEAAYEFFKLKQGSFIKAHYLMKEKVKQEQDVLKISGGFEKNAGQDEQVYGKIDW